jgi:oligoendopeptidase F
MVEVRMNHYKSAGDIITLPSMNWLDPTGHVNFMTAMSGRLPSKMAKEELDARLERWLALTAMKAETAFEEGSIEDEAGVPAPRSASVVEIERLRIMMMDDSESRRHEAFRDRLSHLTGVERSVAILEEERIQQRYKQDRNLVLDRQFGEV